MIFEYFKKKKQAKLDAEEALRKRNALIDEALKFKEEHEAKQMNDTINKEIIMASDVPYYKLLGEEYSTVSPPTDPINERYEYNKAFIKKLRQDGYVGESDAEVITAWEKGEAEKKLEAANKVEREKKMASLEPWIEVVSDHYDHEQQQVAIKLDWNPAFIKMLRQHGFTGRDEQELVDRWFKSVSDSIASEIHGEKFDG